MSPFVAPFFFSLSTLGDCVQDAANPLLLFAYYVYVSISFISPLAYAFTYIWRFLCRRCARYIIFCSHFFPTITHFPNEKSVVTKNYLYNHNFAHIRLSYGENLLICTSSKINSVIFSKYEKKQQLGGVKLDLFINFQIKFDWFEWEWLVAERPKELVLIKSYFESESK